MCTHGSDIVRPAIDWSIAGTSGVNISDVGRPDVGRSDLDRFDVDRCGIDWSDVGGSGIDRCRFLLE